MIVFVSLSALVVVVTVLSTTGVGFVPAPGAVTPTVSDVLPSALMMVVSVVVVLFPPTLDVVVMVRPSEEVVVVVVSITVVPSPPKSVVTIFELLEAFMVVTAVCSLSKIGLPLASTLPP